MRPHPRGRRARLPAASLAGLAVLLTACSTDSQTSAAPPSLAAPATTTSSPSSAPETATASPTGPPPVPPAAVATAVTGAPPATPPTAALPKSYPDPKRVPTPPRLAQLPRGGRQLFPAYRVVCYYGEGTPDGNGILGRGKPKRMIDELKEQADAYKGYGRKVLPCLELVATVAHRRAIGPRRDGSYSRPLDPKIVERHLKLARKHKMLLVLDFQPGRKEFLGQVKKYERFLRQPDVAVALDTEWRTPGFAPFVREAGYTRAEEINEVSDYVATLVRRHKLPQKLFVLHQFRASMLPDRHRVKARKELAISAHIDGFGSPGLKRSVYSALAPREKLHPGFKIFYNLDEPTMTARQAMEMRPRPELLTYQ